MGCLSTHVNSLSESLYTLYIHTLLIAMPAVKFAGRAQRPFFLGPINLREAAADEKQAVQQVVQQETASFLIIIAEA